MEALAATLTRLTASVPATPGLDLVHQVRSFLSSELTSTMMKDLALEVRIVEAPRRKSTVIGQRQGQLPLDDDDNNDNNADDTDDSAPTTNESTPSAQIHPVDMDLVLLKYHQHSMSKELWERPESREARGIVFRWSVGAVAEDQKSVSLRWTCFSRPFDKFFNLFEFHCPLREKDVFAREARRALASSAMASPSRFMSTFADDSSVLAVTEKGDGTCVQLWYDAATLTADHLASRPVLSDAELDAASKGHGMSASPGATASSLDELRQLERYVGHFSLLPGGWRVATLGKSSPDPWLGLLFRRTLGGIKPFQERMLPHLFPDQTYLFELCCAENRVVTRYAADKMFFLGGRSVSSGELLSEGESASLVASWDLPSLSMPWRTTFKQADITDQESLWRWVEKQASAKTFGEVPEGFVVVDRETNAPLAKCKNSQYLQRHSLFTSDLLSNRNIIIERFFDDSLDDIDDLLQNKPPLRALVIELQGKVRLLEESVRQKRQALQQQVEDLSEPLSGREYARIVNEICADLRGEHSALRGFIMANRAGLLREGDNVTVELWEWLAKSNWKKMKGYWKKSEVPELVARGKEVHKDGDE